MIQAVATMPSLIEQTHDALLRAIFDGTLAPGQRLTQEGLADLLKVSRQPISHALVLLKQQGVVQPSGRRGVEVSPVDVDYLQDIYDVRERLDPYAAQRAAQRVRGGAGDAAVTGRMEALGKILEDGLKAAEGGSVGRLIELDIAFHQGLNELAGNAMIVDIGKAQWMHIGRAMGEVLQDPAARLRAWQDHERIYALVRDGRPQDAAEAALRHVASGGGNAVRRLLAGRARAPID